MTSFFVDRLQPLHLNTTDPLCDMWAFAPFVWQTAYGFEMLLSSTLATSAVGYARASTSSGLWNPVETVLEPRAGAWDELAVTSGPIVRWKNVPVMFYAGTGTSSATGWRIGWAAFDEGYHRITERCDVPLRPIRERIPNGGLLGASALPIGAQIWLYAAGTEIAPIRAVLRSKGD